MKQNAIKRNIKRKGFTLIELLVVVLIIGILAAVALPKYQKVVEKTKSVEAITMLKSNYQAAQEYYLIYGKWPKSFKDLSVSSEWTGNTKWVKGADITAALSNKDWSLQISNYSESARGDRLLGMSIGRLSGNYKGVGFIVWSKYGLFWFQNAS